MAKINEITEQRIKDAAHIEDILTNALGVELHRDGANMQGLCPFHSDKNLGSFKVSLSKNICTCFSCGKTWNPINALMEGKQMDYPTALRYIAAMYGIIVDNEPVPTVKRAQIRPKAPELPMLYWNVEITHESTKHDDINPLLTYLYALPLCQEDKARLQLMARLYAIGTSNKGYTQGWTIFWQIDDQLRVRTGKLMAYLPNGHRDKSTNANWMHSLMAKVGMFDSTKYSINTCLFGLHLVDTFPQAEVCIVESEKSALICSAFTEPDQRLWLATGGKSRLTHKMLEPLIARNRYIVLYPDRDGYDEWRAMAQMISYNRISVSPKVNQLWIAADGDKADIADIMLRRLQGITETDAEKAARLLDKPDKAPELAYMIEKLDLKLND